MTCLQPLSYAPTLTQDTVHYSENQGMKHATNPIMPQITKIWAILRVNPKVPPQHRK